MAESVMTVGSKDQIRFFGERRHLSKTAFIDKYHRVTWFKRYIDQNFVAAFPLLLCRAYWVVIVTWSGLSQHAF